MVAALLFVIPLFDAIRSALPARLADAHWRWGVVGQLSGLLLIPLVGLLIAIVVARLAGDRRVSRAIGAMCLLLALLLAIMSVIFVVEYFQIRTTLVPRMRNASSVASVVAVTKHLLSIIVLLLLGRAAFAQPGMAPK